MGGGLHAGSALLAGLGGCTPAPAWPPLPPPLRTPTPHICSQGVDWVPAYPWQQSGGGGRLLGGSGTGPWVGAWHGGPPGPRLPLRAPPGPPGAMPLPRTGPRATLLQAFMADARRRRAGGPGAPLVGLESTPKGRAELMHRMCPPGCAVCPVPLLDPCSFSLGLPKSKGWEGEGDVGERSRWGTCRGRIGRRPAPPVDTQSPRCSET